MKLILMKFRNLKAATLKQKYTGFYVEYKM